MLSLYCKAIILKGLHYVISIMGNKVVVSVSSAVLVIEQNTGRLTYCRFTVDMQGNQCISHPSLL